MFDRKIIKELVRWSEKQDRKPLILRGARQVGKTTAVNIFSKNFDQFIYLNLEEKENHKIFEDFDKFEDILSSIFLKMNMLRSGKKTLIFIDEIQNSPEAISQLRYFREKASDLFVIAAGSLLESVIDSHSGFPVGRVEYMFMYPLNFSEFLTATNENLSSEILDQIPFPDYGHEKLLKLFNTYTLLGGMPEIISNWNVEKDIIRLESIYNSLMQSYIDDVEKYGKSKSFISILRHVIKTAPLESGKRIKFQGFGNSNYRSREVKESFDILEKIMLVRLVYPVTSLKLPIIPDLKKSPKLHFLDTGLINYMSGLQSELFGTKELDDFYEGRIAEHVIGQELHSMNKYINDKMYFWVREKKQSGAEVDFLIMYNNKIVPIEVKSGKSGRLRSLHALIDDSAIDLAIRIFSGKLSFERERTLGGKKYILINLPFYLSPKIKEYIDYTVSNKDKFLK